MLFRPTSKRSSAKSKCALSLPCLKCISDGYLRTADIGNKINSRLVAQTSPGMHQTQHDVSMWRQVLEARVDHARVVDILRKADHLPLIKDYLLAVQKANLAAVNEAINELLIEEDDFTGLRESITTYDNYDQVSLPGCRAWEPHHGLMLDGELTQRGAHQAA